MAQDEHVHRFISNIIIGGCGGVSGGNNRCGDGGCSARSSKKLKQKKVPQRGLGVAQLEKIRLEEQLKKDASAAVLSPKSSLVSTSDSSSSGMAVQCPTTSFRHNPSPSSIPIPSPSSPTDLSSTTNTIFRKPSSVPNINVLHPSSVPLPKPSNGGGGEIGWPGISGLGLSNWPKLWNGDRIVEGENDGLNHPGFAFRPNTTLSSESSPIWPSPPPSVMQRTQQFQMQRSSSTVNVSSGTSSSSAINYQMEPPSNQIFYGNNCTPLWPEEGKMVGTKRPYPFSLDNPSGPSLPCKLPSFYFSPTTRSDESASSGNGGPANVEPSNSVFRERPSSSTFFPEPRQKKVAQENEDLDGDFLTLAPPAVTMPHPSSVHLSRHGHELPEFKPIPFQGSPEDRGTPRGLTQKMPFYSFLPLGKTRISQGPNNLGSCGGEVGENLDLDLKL